LGADVPSHIPALTAVDATVRPVGQTCNLGCNFIMKPLIIPLSASITANSMIMVRGQHPRQTSATLTLAAVIPSRQPETHVARQFFTMTKPYSEIRICWLVGSSFPRPFTVGKLAGR
jgi:hypothetical protein